MSTNIFSLVNSKTFDDEATKAMGVAFDKAVAGLQDTGQPRVVRETIARRIVELAAVGERDPERMAKNVLETFGVP